MRYSLLLWVLALAAFALRAHDNPPIAPAPVPDFTIYDRYLKPDSNWKEIADKAAANDVPALDAVFMNAAFGFEGNTDLKVARECYRKAYQRRAPLAILYRALNLNGYWLDPSIYDPSSAKAQLELLRGFLKPIAEQKRSSFAMAAYGHCLEGLGDSLGALPWMRSAAEQDNPWAMLLLADALWKQAGSLAAPPEALEWLEKAAALKFPPALTRLGDAYLEIRKGPSRVKEGLEQLQKAAERNYAPAQFGLAARYFYGDRVDSNRAEFRKWIVAPAGQEFGPALSLSYQLEFNKEDGSKPDAKVLAQIAAQAMELGDAGGFGCIGDLYMHGRGFPRDMARAAASFQKGVDRNDAFSARNLAILYANGTGVPRDMAKSFALALKAARQNPADGLKTLFKVIAAIDEKKLEIDTSEAARWMKALAEEHHEIVCYHLSQLHLYGYGPNFPNDHKEAFRLMKIAAELNHHESMHEFARYYSVGIGIEASREIAYKWYLTIWDQYHCDKAAMSLGRARLEGMGVQRDEAGGLKLLEDLASRPNAHRVEALQMLHGAFAFGHYKVERDPAKLIKWMKVGAEAKIPTFGLYYAQCLLKGDDKDKEAAIGWLMKAADDEKNAEAAYELGLAHRYGIGTEEDPSYAFKYMKQAAEGDYLWAKWELSEMYRLGIGTEMNEAEQQRWFTQANARGAASKRPNNAESPGPPRPPDNGDF